MDLSHLRKKIDGIDDRIVQLLNERAGMSLAVGRAKTAAGRAIYAPERERDVLERIAAQNRGPLTTGALAAVYREIMSGSLALEKPLRIAHLGEAGSNSHTASVKKFGSQVTYVPCVSIAEVFRNVEINDCDHGVVPIENSVEGAVTHTADMLVDSELQICAQLMFRVTHTLLARGPLNRIRKVYSNPQVLGQCRHWLLANLPPDRVKWISVAATTDAARAALAEKDAAAIASPECAAVYGLPVLREHIQDIPSNTTRFYVIGRQDAPRTGRDRTAIVFGVKDKPGALHAMLAPFTRAGINLTRIESRPMKKKAWQYYFFVDLEGHRDDPKVSRALARLEKECHFLRVLGSFPA